MIFKPRCIVSIDIDQDTITAGRFSKAGNRIQLDYCKVFKERNQLLEDSALRGYPVVISYPSEKLFLKSFPAEHPLSKHRTQKKAALSFLERQLPVGLGDCLWRLFNLDNSCNLVAAKKNTVEEELIQIENYGLKVSGIIPSFIAMYNLFIYAYGKKDGFIVLNIRSASSDIFLFEGGRLWVYPLAQGRQQAEGSPAEQGPFLQEISKALNNHYMQNAQQASPPKRNLYISRSDISEGFYSGLKAELADYEIIKFELFKKIGLTPQVITETLGQAGMCIGAGLTFLGLPQGIGVNLLEEQIKKEQSSARIDILHKAAVALAAAAIIFLSLSLVKPLREHRFQKQLLKTSAFQVSSLLPEAKKLKQEKEGLEKIENFLGEKLSQQSSYIKALAVIAQNKAPSIEITELQSQAKGRGVEIFLTANAPAYDEINKFLSDLKTKPDLKDVKMLSSELPQDEQGLKSVEFRISFYIQ